MARKCDTTKYKKRRARELKNKSERVARREAQERMFREHQRALQAKRQWAWDHDERRLLMQQIIRILNRRLNNDPLYKIMMIGRILGVDSLLYDRIISEEPADFQIGPGRI